MEHINKKQVLDLANELNFTLSDQEIDEIIDEFDILVEQIGLLDHIDTEHVEPMVYPFEAPIAYLREDVVDHVLSVKDALSNAPKKKDGFVIVPKVVL